MRLTVLGACGAWPGAGQASSGYLLEHDGFRLVLDLGYATMPRLLQHVGAHEVDAVFISHQHPDHCVDLNPLLRARALRDDPPAALPVYALPGALDAVLALDRPGMLDHSYVLHDVVPADEFDIGPFHAHTRLLPHSVPNVGIRVSAGGRVLAYTGDTGPSAEVVELARDADLLLAEASYADRVPDDARHSLSDAGQAARQARDAQVRRLVLTHLLPGSDPAAARAVAARSYDGVTDIAISGLAVDLADALP